MKRLFMVLFALAFVQSVGAENHFSSDTQELQFEGYPDAPKFNVVARKDSLTYYPCAQCHQFMEPNPKVRELSGPHPVEFKHGRGRFWCLSCHNATERNTLRTQLDEKVDFNDAYLVCGGCHPVPQKDWYYGAHGKRVDNWQGERKLYNCTHCHDPHEPTIKAREPMATPPVRIGLERQEAQGHHSVLLWDRYVDEHEEESDARH